MWNENIWVLFWQKDSYCQCLNTGPNLVFVVIRVPERPNFTVGWSFILWDVLQRRLLSGLGKNCLKINKPNSREWSYFRVMASAFCSLWGILSKKGKISMKSKTEQDSVLGRKNVDMQTVLQWASRAGIKPFCCLLPPSSSSSNQVTLKEMIERLLFPRDCIIFGKPQLWELV